MLATLTQWENSIAPAVSIEPTDDRTIAVYWGAIIPAIPNLIAIEQDRTGMSYETALQNILQIQQYWIRQLQGDSRFTLSLRIITMGDSSQPLTFGLIGKTDGQQESETIASARNFFNKVRDSFPSGYSLVPCQTVKELAFLRLPFLPDNAGQIAEFRRSLTPLQTITSADLPDITGYQIQPWNAEPGTFQDLFRAFTCHPTPAAIAITIKSTQLTSDESRYLGGLADSYARLASVSRNEGEQLRMMSSGMTMQNKYLEAENASQTWRQFKTNLQIAFECTIALLSATLIPQSIVAALQATVSAKPTTPNSTQLAGSGTLKIATSEAQQIAVRQTWADLTLHRWADDYGFGRLPWLLGAEELHSVFRLPIADRSGTWGLPSAPGATDARRPTIAIASDGEITIGSLHLTKKQLTQHLLICGVPGSGKTNTSLYLLETLWREHQIPWMVLEPAKTEYRGLQMVESLRDDLLIFSLGDERVAPFRFNPFELPIGTNLDSHLGSLLDLFSVSMSMWGPLPNVLEQLIIEAYKRKGFTILGDNQSLSPPTFADVSSLISEIVPRLGYKKETTDEITAAIAVRLNKFCRGATGRMLNTVRSFPFEELMKRPVILEMSQLTNSDDRAFIMGLILNRCYQYWTARRHEATGELKHLLLVEEAHNLLANASESSSQEQANPKGKAVRNFANMLAEVRGFGQGIAIAEQNPEGLVSDVLVNTNIKLAHRIVEAKNRETLGRSMLLTSQQEKGLASLKTGQMLYYIGGDPEPSATSVPNFKDAENGFNPRLTDAEIHRTFQNSVQRDYAYLYALPIGCPTDAASIVCFEVGTDLLQMLTEQPQYKSLKPGLVMNILAAPFGAPAKQKAFEVFSRILLARGASSFSTVQVNGIFESALSLLAIEAVQAKGKAHGWLGDQMDLGHELLIRSLLQGPTDELQTEWLKLCQIPDSLLQLGLPHPGYNKCRAPGAFRYENQVLMLGDQSVFKEALEDTQSLPSMAIEKWSETQPIFSYLSSSQKYSLINCLAIQITEASPDDLYHFWVEN